MPADPSGAETRPVHACHDPLCNCGGMGACFDPKCEVSPRSSRGAPNDPTASPLILNEDELRIAGRSGDWGTISDSHKAALEYIAALRATVSALRQEAATLAPQIADLREVLNAENARLETQLAAARQEAETLRQEVAGLRGALTIEVETNVKLGATLSASHAEAETLRSQLDALRFIGARLANVAYNMVQDESIDRHRRASLNGLREEWDAVIQQHGAAARVAAPREPK